VCKEDPDSPWGELFSLFDPPVDKSEAAALPQAPRSSQTRLQLTEFRLVEFPIAMIAAAEKRARHANLRSQPGLYGNA
jgi:hypothetical protein